MLTPSLEELRGRSLLRAIDYHFAKDMCRLVKESSAEVAAAAAMVSARLGEGHVCLDLSSLAGQSVQLQDSVVRQFPSLPAWRETMMRSELVSDGSLHTPLILDQQDRLYLRRYWIHEQFLARAILERCQGVESDAEEGSLQASLERLFGQGTLADDDQRMAALMAARRQFSVVSGGPGTGKTFTVVKILALLIEQAFAEGSDPPRMQLMAPTGKAAARLVESIKRAKQELDCEPEVKEAIVEEASTIHRALGASGHGTRYRYHQNNPLVTDLVLVDEASMVNVSLMSRLLAAVPEGARVILLGDRDQLASVEAGAVLADICEGGRHMPRSKALAREIEDITGESIELAADAPTSTGIWDCVTHLSRSYRYKSGSGIEKLALAIHAGDAEAAIEVLRDPGVADVRLASPLPRQGIGAELLKQSVRGYHDAQAAQEPAQAHAALEQFRVLCAHHEGAASVSLINTELARHYRNNNLAKGLAQAHGLDPKHTSGVLAEHYHLQPIIIGVNDYELGLFNGDLGVLMNSPSGLRAYFAGEGGRMRDISPSRLPAHQPVYAMSIHKSQGSEFNDIAVVLPRELSPVLTRELIYTAVTRAKRSLTIYASESVLGHCIAQRTERSTGLQELLWGELAPATTDAPQASLEEAPPPTPVLAPTQVRVVVQAHEDQALEDQAPAEQAHTEQAPAEQAHTEQAPAEQAHTEQASEERAAQAAHIEQPGSVEEAIQPQLLPMPPSTATNTRAPAGSRPRSSKKRPATRQLALDLDGLVAQPKPAKPERQRASLRRAVLPSSTASCCGHKSAALLRCPRCAHIWVECCTCQA